MCVQVRQPSRARKVCLGPRGLLRSARTSCRAFDFNMNDNNNNKKDIENNNKNNDDNKDIINNINNNNNNDNKDIDNNDKQITTASKKQ